MRYAFVAQDVPFWVEKWTCSGATTNVWVSVPIISIGPGLGIVNTTVFFSAQTAPEVAFHQNMQSPAIQMEPPIDSYRVFAFSSAPPGTYLIVQPWIVDNSTSSRTLVTPYSRLYARSRSVISLPAALDVVMPVNVSAAFLWSAYSQALVLAGGGTVMVTFQSVGRLLTLSAPGISSSVACTGLIFSCDITLSSVSCSCGGAAISVPNPSPGPSYFYCSSSALFSMSIPGAPTQPRIIVRHPRVSSVAISVALSSRWRFHYSFSRKLHRLASDSLYPVAFNIQINLNGQILNRSPAKIWSQFTARLPGFPLCGPTAYGNSFLPSRAPATGKFDLQIFNSALSDAAVTLALVSSANGAGQTVVIATSICVHVRSSTTLLCHFGAMQASTGNVFVQLVVGGAAPNRLTAQLILFSTLAADMPVSPTSVGVAGGSKITLSLDKYAVAVGTAQLGDTLFPANGAKGVHLALSNVVGASTFNATSHGVKMLADPVITNSSDQQTASADFMVPPLTPGVWSMWVSLFPGQWALLGSELTVLGACPQVCGCIDAL